MVNKYVITILSRGNNEEEPEKIISTYHINKSDEITIYDNKIIINCERTRKIKDVEKYLMKSSNSIVKQIYRALSYRYLTRGNSLDNIEIYVNDTKVNLAINNPFIKTLDTDLIAKKSEIVFLFTNKYNELLTSLTWFIKGYGENSFDYTWRAFNALFSFFTSEKKDFECLKAIRSFIESNQGITVNCNRIFDSITETEIRKLDIRDFVLADYSTISKTKSYSDMVKSFVDERMMDLFLEIMPIRRDFLLQSNLFKETNDYINEKKAEGIKNNTDIIRFYFLKYCYYIRNKYFHAEKRNPNFIFKNSSEQSQLNELNNNLLNFVADLYNCFSLYKDLLA